MSYDSLCVCRDGLGEPSLSELLHTHLSCGFRLNCCNSNPALVRLSLLVILCQELVQIILWLVFLVMSSSCFKMVVLQVVPTPYKSSEVHSQVNVRNEGDTLYCNLGISLTW